MSVSMVPKRQSNSLVQVHIQPLYRPIMMVLILACKSNLLKGFNSAKTQPFSVPVLDDDQGTVCGLFWWRNHSLSTS
jgi:hypothetical protein